MPRPIRKGHNAAYRLSLAARPRILRISPPGWRTRSQLEAELDFIEHLARRGLPVGRPIPGPDGRRVLCLERGLHACQFRWLPGSPVVDPAATPDSKLLRAWGELLGQLHRAALEHRPIPGRLRPHWARDPLAGCPRSAIASGEARLAAAREELVGWASSLPESPDFGLVHGDASLVNVMARPNGPALFDFDDCCRHHFEWELACAIHPHRLRHDFPRLVDGLLEACERVQPVPSTLPGDLPRWLRLRTLSVLLYFRQRRRPGDAWVARATREVVEGR